MSRTPESRESDPVSEPAAAESESTSKGTLLAIALALLVALGAVAFVVYQAMNWKPDEMPTPATAPYVTDPRLQEQGGGGPRPAPGGGGPKQGGGKQGGPKGKVITVSTE